MGSSSVCKYCSFCAVAIRTALQASVIYFLEDAWVCTCLARFVGTASMLSLKDSEDVSLRSRRVQPLAIGGPSACAKVEAFATTIESAKLSENAVVNAWSSKLTLFSPSSSSSSSTTTTISFAGFFVLLFFSLGLVFVHSGPHQYLQTHSEAHASAHSSRNGPLRVFSPCLTPVDRVCRAVARPRHSPTFVRQVGRTVQGRAL